MYSGQTQLFPNYFLLVIGQIQDANPQMLRVGSVTYIYFGRRCSFPRANERQHGQCCGALQSLGSMAPTRWWLWLRTHQHHSESSFLMSQEHQGVNNMQVSLTVILLMQVSPNCFAPPQLSQVQWSACRCQSEGASMYCTRFSLPLCPDGRLRVGWLCRATHRLPRCLCRIFRRTNGRGHYCGASSPPQLS